MNLDYFTLELQRRQHPAWRLLDASSAVQAHGLLHAAGDQDITLTQADFAALQLPVNGVFITENEVNFLAFPAVPQSLVVFGAGYGFDALADARWLHACQVLYWGDIDTHGFAILDQLRAQRLRDNTPIEKCLKTASVRLEQERIGLACLERALTALPATPVVKPSSESVPALDF